MPYVPIFPKFLQMGTRANGHFGEWSIPSALKEFLKGLMPIFLKIFANGHEANMGTWGKWSFGRKGYPKCSVPILPTFFKWAWGKMDFWGRGYPKCPKEVPQGPHAHFSQIFANGHGANGHLDKWSFGERNAQVP